MTFKPIIVDSTISRDYGYTAGGGIGLVRSDVTEKYDDVANTWTTKTPLTLARMYLAGFSLNGYGYTAGGLWAGGIGFSDVTEKYDDVANTWTTKTPLNTQIYGQAGFSLNGYGYSAGGCCFSAVTEKYNDVANTWTTKANLNTARTDLAGFSLNGYGYTAGGLIGSTENPTTEKYDDVANTWTAKANLNTARWGPAGFSLNGYGYTAGGGTHIGGGSAVTEKYDDVANTWTTKANLNTARIYIAGFSLNGYGYSAGGDGPTAVTEKYDDVANTWTYKANMNTARGYLTGFSLGSIHGGVQNYDIIDIYKIIRDPRTVFNALAAALSIGQVVFPNVSGLLTGDTNLFWDNTNKRLGVATSSPGAGIDLAGAQGSVAGQIRVTDGVVGFPSYTFRTASNSGLTSVAGNTVSLAAGGTEAIRAGLPGLGSGLFFYQLGAATTGTPLVLTASNEVRPLQAFQQNEVVGLRAANTPYQNTGNTPMFVQINFSDNSVISASLNTDVGNPPTHSVWGLSTVIGIRYSATTWVLPGNWYEITAGGTVTLYSWTEWTWG